MLVFAVPPIWPYGYYVLLRFVVCGVSVFGIFDLRNAKPVNVAILGVVAVLFNPLIPVHLSKEAWIPIDLVVAGYFGYIAWRISKAIPGKK